MNNIILTSDQVSELKRDGNVLVKNTADNVIEIKWCNHLNHCEVIESEKRFPYKEATDLDNARLISESYWQHQYSDAILTKYNGIWSVQERRE